MQLELQQPAKAYRPRQKTKSRFLLEPLSGRRAVMPAHDAAFIVEGRTKYPSTITDPTTHRVLKSGVNQAKIGGRVNKGAWAGMPIYCLTLEERATCPPDCFLWRACYGNGMNWAERMAHGPELESRLETEVRVLAAGHPKGFAVRLHILGDFYSVDYVRLWARLVDEHPELHVFGFSARWQREDPIAVELVRYASEHWDRFAIRFSNAPIDTCSTVTIEHAGACPSDAIICPQQSGKTESCSNCALCWSSDQRIAFIRH